MVSVSPMLPPIPLGWRYLLKEETPKSYYRALDAFLEKELAGGQTILPARKDIFNALASTSYDQVRVLLVGQDPYPTPGHAHGLCFSVQLTVRPLPLSLRNVYRELHDDVGCQISNNGCLEPWARQGILMLNTVLTVQAHKANSLRDAAGYRKTVSGTIPRRAAGCGGGEFCQALLVSPWPTSILLCR